MAVFVNDVHPYVDVVECSAVGCVVDEQDAVGAAVKLVGQRILSLLPGRVPQVQPDSLIIHL